MYSLGDAIDEGYQCQAPAKQQHQQEEHLGLGGAKRLGGRAAVGEQCDLVGPIPSDDETKHI